MANYYGVNKTKTLTPTGENIVSAGDLGGRVRVMYDSYEAAGEAAGSIIYMGQKLPVGARVLEVILAHDAVGSATIKVGDIDDDDRYIAASSVSSAGILGMDEAALVDGLGYEVDGDNDQDIILTTASAAITGTLKLIVYYVVD